MKTRQVKKRNSEGSFEPKESARRSKGIASDSPKWSMFLKGEKYVWNTKMDRVALIRKGLPYDSVEVLSQKTDLPVKQVLKFFNLAQTTYNKKKRENELLGGRDSEIVLVLFELLDFGKQVFNNESEKFQRWLKKPNLSLGGVAPKSLFDTITGIQEVQKSLYRIEYGNMA